MNNITFTKLEVVPLDVSDVDTHDNNSSCCNDDLPSDELTLNTIHKNKQGLRVKGEVRLHGKKTDKIIILPEDRYVYTATGPGVTGQEDPIKLSGSSTSTEMSSTIRSLFGDIIRSIISRSMPQNRNVEIKAGDLEILQDDERTIDESMANGLYECTSIGISEAKGRKSSKVGKFKDKLSKFAVCFGFSKRKKKQKFLSEHNLINELMIGISVDGDMNDLTTDLVKSTQIDDLYEVNVHFEEVYEAQKKIEVRKEVTNKKPRKKKINPISSQHIHSVRVENYPDIYTNFFVFPSIPVNDGGIIDRLGHSEEMKENENITTNDCETVSNTNDLKETVGNTSFIIDAAIIEDLKCDLEMTKSDQESLMKISDQGAEENNENSSFWRKNLGSGQLLDNEFQKNNSSSYERVSVGNYFQDNCKSILETRYKRFSILDNTIQHSKSPPCTSHFIKPSRSMSSKAPIMKVYERHQLLTNLAVLSIMLKNLFSIKRQFFLLHYLNILTSYFFLRTYFNRATKNNQYYNRGSKMKCRRLPRYSQNVNNVYISDCIKHPLDRHKMPIQLKHCTGEKTDENPSKQPFSNCKMMYSKMLCPSRCCVPCHSKCFTLSASINSNEEYKYERVNKFLDKYFHYNDEIVDFEKSVNELKNIDIEKSNITSVVYVDETSEDNVSLTLRHRKTLEEAPLTISRNDVMKENLSKQVHVDNALHVAFLSQTSIYNDEVKENRRVDDNENVPFHVSEIFYTQKNAYSSSTKDESSLVHELDISLSKEDFAEYDSNTNTTKIKKQNTFIAEKNGKLSDTVDDITDMDYEFAQAIVDNLPQEVLLETKLQYRDAGTGVGILDGKSPKIDRNSFLINSTNVTIMDTYDTTFHRESLSIKMENKLVLSSQSEVQDITVVSHLVQGTTNSKEISQLLLENLSEHSNTNENILTNRNLHNTKTVLQRYNYQLQLFESKSSTTHYLHNEPLTSNCLPQHPISNDQITTMDDVSDISMHRIPKSNSIYYQHILKKQNNRHTVTDFHEISERCKCNAPWKYPRELLKQYSNFQRKTVEERCTNKDIWQHCLCNSKHVNKTYLKVQAHYKRMQINCPNNKHDDCNTNNQNNALIPSKNSLNGGLSMEYIEILRKYYKAFLDRSLQTLIWTKGQDFDDRTRGTDEECEYRCRISLAKYDSLNVHIINNQNSIHRNINFYPMKAMTNKNCLIHNSHLKQRNFIECPPCSSQKPSFFKIFYTIYRPIFVHRITNLKLVTQAKAKERLPRISFVQNNRKSNDNAQKPIKINFTKSTTSEMKISDIMNVKNALSKYKTNSSTSTFISHAFQPITANNEISSVKSIFCHMIIDNIIDHIDLDLNISSCSLNLCTLNNTTKTSLLYDETNSDRIEKQDQIQNQYLTRISSKLDLHSSDAKYTIDYESELKNTSKILNINEDKMYFQSDRDYLDNDVEMQNKHLATLSPTVDLHTSISILTVDYDDLKVPTGTSISNQNETDIHNYEDIQERDIKEQSVTRSSNQDLHTNCSIPNVPSKVLLLSQTDMNKDVDVKSESLRSNSRIYHNELVEEDSKDIIDGAESVRKTELLEIDGTVTIILESQGKENDDIHTDEKYFDNDVKMQNKHLATLSPTVDLHTSKSMLTVDYDGLNVPTETSISNQNEMDIPNNEDIQEPYLKEHSVTRSTNQDLHTNYSVPHDPLNVSSMSQIDMNKDKDVKTESLRSNSRIYHNEFVEEEKEEIIDGAESVRKSELLEIDTTVTITLQSQDKENDDIHTDEKYFDNDVELQNKHLATLSPTIDLHTSKSILTVDYGDLKVPTGTSIPNQNETDIHNYEDIQERDVKEQSVTRSSNQDLHTNYSIPNVPSKVLLLSQSDMNKDVDVKTESLRSNSRIYHNELVEEDNENIIDGAESVIKTELLEIDGTVSITLQSQDKENIHTYEKGN